MHFLSNSKRAVVCTTPHLLAMHRNSVSKGYNRALPDDVISRLDPYGIHVATFQMHHMRELRTHWLAKFSNTTEPVMVAIDCDHEVFASNHRICTEGKIASILFSNTLAMAIQEEP